MKNCIKSIIKKLIAWYVAPLQEQIQRLLQDLKGVEKSVNVIQDQMRGSTHRVADIEGREEWTRDRFEEHDSRLADIESREEWTRGQFEEHDSRLVDIEGRGEWTRGRIKEQDSRLADIEGREEWTRGRFEEQDSRLADIEGREEWTRGRFEEQDSRLADIEGREEWTRDRFEDQEQKIRELKEMMEQLYLQVNQCGDECGEESFSQSGEDAIISYIFRFMRIPAESVTYLDLGANHAKKLSNTYCFYQKGASGVLVEANPELIPELKRERSRDVILNCIVGPEDGTRNTFYVLSSDGLSTTDLESAKAACAQNPELYFAGRHEIKMLGINTILEKYCEQVPTIFSIDLEGGEEEILRHIDFVRYRPLIIILENVPYTPLLPVDQREFRGVELLKDCGYTEYAFTGINSIFIDMEQVSRFNRQRAKELESFHWEDTCTGEGYRMPYHSLNIEGLTYFYSEQDRVIPECMLKSGINYAKGDIDNFICLADTLFYRDVVPSDGFFLDIGANIGTTTVYCKKKKKPQLKYIAFEPVEKNAALLAANCAINGLTEGVVIEKMAVSNSDDTIVKMVIDESNSGSCHCENSLGETEGTRLSVCTTSLDCYISKRHISAGEVKYIWIDVEGHELEVLEGARRLYSKTIPTCLEFNQDIYKKVGTYQRIVELLQKFFTKFAVCVQVAGGNRELRAIEEIGNLWTELEGHACDLILL